MKRGTLTEIIKKLILLQYLNILFFFLIIAGLIFYLYWLQVVDLATIQNIKQITATGF